MYIPPLSEESDQLVTATGVASCSSSQGLGQSISDWTYIYIFGEYSLAILLLHNSFFIILFTELAPRPNQSSVAMSVFLFVCLRHCETPTSRGQKNFRSKGVLPAMTPIIFGSVLMIFCVFNFFGFWEPPYCGTPYC